MGMKENDLPVNNNKNDHIDKIVDNPETSDDDEIEEEDKFSDVEIYSDDDSKIKETLSFKERKEKNQEFLKKKETEFEQKMKDENQKDKEDDEKHKLFFENLVENRQNKSGSMYFNVHQDFSMNLGTHSTKKSVFDHFISFKDLTLNRNQNTNEVKIPLFDQDEFSDQQSSDRRIVPKSKCFKITFTLAMMLISLVLILVLTQKHALV